MSNAEYPESNTSSLDPIPGFQPPSATDGKHSTPPLPEDFDPRKPAWWPSIEGYTIQRWVGGGGFGSVYHAHSTRLDATVAIKILNPQKLTHPDAAERFAREVTTAAQNRHRHVLQVLDTGYISGSVWNNCQFMVTEFLAGGDLHQWLDRHPRSSRSDENLKLAVRKVAEICSGLHAMHEAGVLHRDIKPDNILLDAEEVPKIADFGLATVFKPGRAANLETLANPAPLDNLQVHSQDNLTRAEDVMGTRGFIAPELFLGMHYASPASDQYSIGVILYIILCDLRPFQNHRKDPDEHLRIRELAKQVEQKKPAPTPSPSSKNGIRDPGLQFICLKALRPEPELRYKSVEDLRTDLERWLNGERVGDHKLTQLWNNHVYRPVKTRPLYFLSLTAAVISFIALIALLTASLKHQTEVERKNEDLQQANNTAQKNLERALNSETDLRNQLISTYIAQGQTAASRGEMDLAMLAWAAAWQKENEDSAPQNPAQQQVAGHQKRTALASRFQFQIKHTLIDSNAVRDLALSPSGDRLVLNQGGRLCIADPRSGLRLIDQLKMPSAIYKFALSPNAAAIAAVTRNIRDTPLLGLFDANSGEYLRQVELDLLPADLAFSPDGSRIALCSSPTNPLESSGKLEIRNAQTLELLEATNLQGPAAKVAFHPDGNSIAVIVNLENAHIAIYSPGQLDKPRRAAIPPSREFCALAFSPNGQKLAAASCDGAAVILDTNTETLEAKTLLNLAALAAAIDGYGRKLGFVRFSKDGELLAAACGDRTVRFWETKSGTETKPPLPLNQHVTAIDLSSDEKYCITSSLDETAIVWDISNGQPLPGRLRHRGAVLNAAFVPGENTVLTAGDDGVTRFWNLTTTATPVNAPDAESETVQIVLSPDAELSASQDDQRCFQVFETNSRKPVSPLFACEHSVHLLAFAPNNNTLALAGLDFAQKGAVSIVNTRSGEPVAESFSLDQLPLRFSFSPDSRFLAIIVSNPKKKYLLVRDLQNNTSHEIPELFPDSLAWNPTANAQLFVGNRDGRLFRVSLPEFTPQETGADSNSQIIRSIAFSPDGTSLALTSVLEVRIYNTSKLSDNNPQILKHEQMPVGSVFSPDGRKLISWGEEGVIQLWNRNKPDQAWKLVGTAQHAAAVNAATFNRDSTLFASASNDGTAAVWDAANCAQVGPNLKHTLPDRGVREVHDVRFSNDGNAILTATENSDDLIARLTTPQPQKLLPPDLRGGFTTFAPFFLRSLMHGWKWDLTSPFNSPDEALFAAAYLSGTEIDGNGQFRRLDRTRLQDLLAKIPDSQPLAPALRQQLGRLAFEDEDYQTAAAEFKKAIQLSNSENGLLWLDLANSLKQLDLVEEALAAFQKAEQLGYTNVKLYLSRGIILSRNARFDQALPDFEQAAQKAQLPVEALLELANCLAELNQLDLAAEKYAAAAEAAKTFGVAIPPDARYKQVVLEYARNHPQQAIALAQSFLNESANSSNPETCYFAALAALLTNDPTTDHTPALKLAQTARELSPDSPLTAAALALALIRTNQLTEARTILQPILKPADPADPAIPNSPLPHYLHALLLKAQNQTQQATTAQNTAEQLHKAILAQPNSPKIRNEYPWSRRILHQLLNNEFITP